MAITKKLKVSFDVTVKLDLATEEQLAELVQGIAKKAASGEKLDGYNRELLVQALTYGPDGAVEHIMRKCLRDGIKEMFNELGDKELYKVAPATVRAVK